MDRIKKIINKHKNAVSFILVILLFFLLGKIHELASTIFMISATVIGLGYSVFTTYNYRKGKLTHVVFPSVNDSHYEFQFFFFSGFLALGAAFFFYIDYIMSIWLYVVGLLIILLLFNGFYKMPHGFLKIKKGVLRAYGLQEEIKIEEINHVEIFHNRIVIKSLRGKTWLVSNIMVDQLTSEEIADYLSKNLVNQSVTIVNQLDSIANRNSSI